MKTGKTTKDKCDVKRQGCKVDKLVPMASFLFDNPAVCQKLCKEKYAGKCKFVTYDNFKLNCSLYNSKIEDLTKTCKSEITLSSVGPCKVIQSKCQVHKAVDILPTERS